MTHDVDDRADVASRIASAAGLALALVVGDLLRPVRRPGQRPARRGLEHRRGRARPHRLAAAVLLGPALLALRGRWYLLRRNAALLVAVRRASPSPAASSPTSTPSRTCRSGVALLIEYTAPVAVVVVAVAAPRPPTGPADPGRRPAGAASDWCWCWTCSPGPRSSGVGVLWALGAMLGAATYFVLSAQEGNGLPPLVLAAGRAARRRARAGPGRAGRPASRWRATTAPVTYAGATVPWWVPVLAPRGGDRRAGLHHRHRRGPPARLAAGVLRGALRGAGRRSASPGCCSGELPRPVQLLGGALILAGVVVVKLGEPGRPPADPAARPHDAAAWSMKASGPGNTSASWPVSDQLDDVRRRAVLAADLDDLGLPHGTVHLLASYHEPVSHGGEHREPPLLLHRRVGRARAERGPRSTSHSWAVAHPRPSDFRHIRIRHRSLAPAPQGSTMEGNRDPRRGATAGRQRLRGRTS